MAAALAILSPVTGSAGPWPRDKGAHFLSVSATGRTVSVWVERGLGRGYTLLFDARRDENGGWGGALRLQGTLRQRGRWVMAWSVGVALDMPTSETTIDLRPVPWPGQREIRITWRPGVALQLGLGAGRSLSRPWPGWLALDLRATLGRDGWRRLQAEGTLGLQMTHRWGVMIQTFAEAGRGRPQLALSPSVIVRVSPSLRLNAGVHHDLRNRQTKARLSTWLEF